MSFLSRMVVLLAFAPAIPFEAQASPRYEYTAVGLANEKSGAYGLSNSGYITGRLTRGLASRAFVFSHGSLTELQPLPGDAETLGTDVNNRGQVVGRSSGGFASRAFLYADGVMIDVGPSNQDATANAINDAGVVVGCSTVGASLRAFVYRDGATHPLGTLNGGQSSCAYGINNRQQIVGVSDAMADPFDDSDHAFLYENGVMKDLGTLGGPRSAAYAINERGQVAGASTTMPDDFSFQHAFLYSGGVMHDLGTPVAGVSSQANGINNHGQVVGWFAQDRGRAMIYQRRGGVRDLSAMVDPSSGWFIHAAYAINDRQQIVALGCKDGQYGAVLLNPVHRGGWLESAAADMPAAARQPGVLENPPCPPG
jgi:probable HAF family extracellular repeat protein